MGSEQPVRSLARSPKRETIPVQKLLCQQKRVANASIREAAKLRLPHYIIEECLRLVEMLADDAEGIAAFNAKRAPRFRGR